jgi:hypothetical protein
MRGTKSAPERDRHGNGARSAEWRPATHGTYGTPTSVECTDRPRREEHDILRVRLDSMCGR